MISLNDYSKKQILFLSSIDGDKLSFSNDNCVVKDKTGHIKHQSTCYRLFLIIVIGNISITSGLIQKAKKFQFSIALMTMSFKLYGFIGSKCDGNTMLKELQYNNNDFEIGKHIIKNKLFNQRNILIRERNKGEYTKKAIKEIDAAYKSLDFQLINLTGIMGIEGSAARSYFSQMFDYPEWGGRIPRIKSDYINTLLDIGYTMLFTFIEAILSSFGFDLYVGFLHRRFYMRKSLVCDIIEPFRPIIDYRIRKGINLKQFNFDDFIIVDNMFCLKNDKSLNYVAVFLEEIVSYKDKIFKYIQSFYRAFMKQVSIDKYPVFDIRS